MFSIRDTSSAEELAAPDVVGATNARTEKRTVRTDAFIKFSLIKRDLIDKDKEPWCPRLR
jgi:hypothetical protein